MANPLPYCPACKNKVMLKKHFSWLWFFLTEGAYLFYYWFKSPDVCAICGTKLVASSSTSWILGFIIIASISVLLIFMLL